jgi:predicted chitinase
VREAYYLGEPRAEHYRKTLRYYPFYGRGYVQLTWDYNYAKMAALTGADLVGHPDLALDPKIAALIMFEGMTGGLFTGRKLADYFSDHRDDPVGARFIINGQDCANEIAGHHADFLAGLS